MRSWIVVVIVAAVIVGSASHASAQPLEWKGSLTLDQAITRAQSAGFDVRLAQADADEAAAHAAGTRATYLPQIGVSGTTSNGGITQFGTPYAQQTYLLATASVPLFAPNAYLSANADASSALAAQQSTVGRRSDAMLLVTQAYERALLARAVVESRSITVAYQRRYVDDVAARVRTGDVPRYRLFEVQAALARSQQSLEDASADRDGALSDLEVVLDLALSPSLALSDSLMPLTLTGDEGSFGRRAMVRRPDILAARAQMDAARARVAAARSRYLPTIAANAQTYNGHSNPALGSTGYQVGITASLPVVDSGARPAELHEADAALDRAQAALDQAELSAQRDVANAWRIYQAAQRNVETAHAQSTSASEEMRVALLRDRAGKGTTLETLSAFVDDASARENALSAIARLNNAIASVHHAAGDLSIKEPQ